MLRIKHYKFPTGILTIHPLKTKASNCAAIPFCAPMISLPMSRCEAADALREARRRRVPITLRYY